ncbi:hypothetical protein GRI44_07050 [Altererythrobacter confluentis]|uniref:Large polyvalent protein-associated domain-containing protein n=1 Tax=Allopontixanthobacter confluentis TaxID=1849021 RepID=A0A6L7GG37_9SPHN|nr:LPD7 domain-containing protein [Allopontixanthobacter confluentis]MXP14505.1 hypothetical protein [Allopontixanthobacter confluentis]
MMAKMIPYKGIFGSAARPATSDRNLLGISWSLAKYIANLELDEIDLQNLREVAKIGEYVVGDTAEGARIQDRRTCNLESDSWQDRALEWAYLVAAHGENALRQLIVSYNDASITIDIARKHQEVFLRVLRAQDYPVIFSTHGDTDNPHWHAAICVHDVKNDQRGNWGQQFEIEASHIALAICVFEDQLQCEPNRRYVADHTGVYHTWSGIKVASADGTIESTGRLKVVQSRQIAFVNESVAPDAAETQTMNMFDALRLTASGVVKEAKSWSDLHCGLARCGMRYDTYTAAGKIVGGYIVAINPDDREDDRINGSVCNAGYIRLVKKFGDKPFAAPVDGLRTRSFIKPTYSKKSLEDQSCEQKEKERAAKEANLSDQLSKTLAEKHRMQRDMKLKESADYEETGSVKIKRIRDASKRLKQEHDQERAAVAGVKAAIRKDRQKPGRGRPSPAGPVEAIIWGVPPAGEFPKVSNFRPVPDTWKKKYTILGQAFPRDYVVGGKLAFTETQNLIVLKNYDRQAQIDALLLAQQKFGTVKIHGTRKQRRILIGLAAELGVPLGRSQSAQGARHLARVNLTGEWLSINQHIDLHPTTDNQLAPIEPDDGKSIEVTRRANAPPPPQNLRAVIEGASPSRKISAKLRPKGKPGTLRFHKQKYIDLYLEHTRDPPDDIHKSNDGDFTISGNWRDPFDGELKYASERQHAELSRRYEVQEKELSILADVVMKFLQELGPWINLKSQIGGLNTSEGRIAWQRLESELGQKIVTRLQRSFREEAETRDPNTSETKTGANKAGQEIAKSRTSNGKSMAHKINDAERTRDHLNWDGDRSL